MRFSFFFLLLLLLNHSSIRAQRKSRVVLPQGISFVRLNFTGLFDPVETNFSVGYEYRLKEKMSLAADLGYLFYSVYFENITGTSGYIFRPSIRLFIDEKNRGYFDTEIHYKHTNYKIEDWLGRGCVNGIPAYEEFTTFKYKRDILGLHLKIGYQGMLSRNGKFWYEIYTGAGIRGRWEKLKNEPGSCYNNATAVIEFNSINQNISYAIPTGLRLLYKWK
jgi:hypothetical protein